MMMGGMGLFMLLGLIVAIAAVFLIVRSFNNLHTVEKPKNDELTLNGENYSVEDDGEIIEYPETKVKRHLRL